MNQPKPLHLRRLTSGGLITNYYCTSRCRHCLYACGPRWEKRYIEAETAAANFRKIRQLGCHSVHIGGGEPLLNPEGLAAVLAAARDAGVGVEYVETNSSWFIDPEEAAALLTSLKKLGLAALLISISPFHNEYIPFKRVKSVIAACRAAEIQAFPWINEFYREIDSFNDGITHGLEEYAAKFGADYLKRLPSRYWIHLGGRAVKTFQQAFPARSLEAVCADSRAGCRELLDTRHFHLDLFGNYIPGLCSGLAVKAEDLGGPLDAEAYPLLTALFNTGVAGLLDYAASQGFEPTEAYVSKCHLCLEIRSYLALEKQIGSAELQPLAFYENLGS
ncbi:MAG: radical SAM protein [Deltaproteobacteria bacterium]|nr:MAG: radical SAM protein [Deltaproteobacteria bacterium]